MTTTHSCPVVCIRKCQVTTLTCKQVIVYKQWHVNAGKGLLCINFSSFTWPVCGLEVLRCISTVIEVHKLCTLLCIVLESLHVSFLPMHAYNSLPTGHHLNDTQEAMLTAHATTRWLARYGFKCCQMCICSRSILPLQQPVICC